MRFLRVALVVMLACAAPCAGAGMTRALWSVNLDTLLESAATVADVNGDGRDEVVVAGQGALYALDGRGKVLWKWEATGRFCTYPAVLARAGKEALIYAATAYEEYLYCVDGRGKEVWRAKLNGGSSWSAAVVCDLEGDGKQEVVQTDGQGTVWAFDALTGKARWQVKVEGVPVSPAVGDIDGDGKAEVVVATGSGDLYALRGEGAVMWRQDLGSASPSWQTGAPVVFGSAQGGARIAVGTSGGELMCFDGKGKLLWQRGVKGPVASSISVADFDGDGGSDVFCVTERGRVWRFGEEGRVLWSLDMRGRTLAPGAIIDVNGDGQLEYVLCTQGGRLMILGQKCELLMERQFEHRTINGTPAFGEIRPDVAGLEMALTGGEAGKVLCFATGARQDGARAWPSYRHDVRMSGAAEGEGRRAAGLMAPENLGPGELLCGQDVRFRVSGPASSSKPMRATASCAGPDGSRQSVIVAVAQGSYEVALPVEALSAGTYTFEWRLDDAQGRPAAQGRRQLFVEPFANDRSLVRYASASLREAAGAAEAGLPLSATALRREARLLEVEAGALMPVQEGALSPRASREAEDEALKRTGALTASALRGLRLAEVVRQAIALGKNTSIVAFEPQNMWENLGVPEQLPAGAEGAAGPLAVKRRVAPGEHEPVAVSLLNITDRPLTVRAFAEAGEGGPSVVLRRAVGSPTPLGDITWDALPELDDSSSVTIPSLTAGQVWVDIDLAGVKPGKHEVTVRFQAIDGSGVLEGPRNRLAVFAPETEARIALEVMPLEMAPPGSFRMCTWGYVESSRFRDYAERMYEDFLAHGNNVFPFSGLPATEYDTSGALTKPLDWAPLEALIGRFKGKDVVLLLQGYPPLKAVGGAGGTGSAAYKNALKQYLAELVAHMTAMGFGRKQYALYPTDEPGGQGWPAVKQLVEFATMVKAIDPAVSIYTDGGGEVAMYEAMAPVIDVWCPALNSASYEPEKIAIIRRPGNQLWSYNCSYSNSTEAGRSLRAADNVAEYRAAALVAFRYGLTGIGFWTSITGAEDPWTRTDGYDYMMLYPGRKGPVTSRRWEAVREGIEDYRILAALRAGAEKAGGGLAARVRGLTDVSLPRFVDDVMNFQQIPQHLDEEMKAVREEMMECAAAVAARDKSR